MTKKNKWLNPAHIRLMAGEMTAAEMRCVLAVIGPIVAELDAAELDAAELDAARLNAKRYLNLKQLSMMRGYLLVSLQNVLQDTRGTCAEFDAAIDAAIAQQKGKT
jgi:hypothetical protein